MSKFNFIKNLVKINLAKIKIIIIVNLNSDKHSTQEIIFINTVRANFYVKGTGTRDLIWLKVVSLDRSWLVGLTDDL